MPAPSRRVAGHRRRAAPDHNLPDHNLPDQSPPDPIRPDDEPVLLVVGRIGRPQGIRGEVTVEVRTDDPDARFADGVALLTEPPERGPLTVVSTRNHSGRLIMVLEGVEDRSQAELLRDTLLQVDARTLPPTGDPDSFHDHELVGLRVELGDGSPLGEVGEVLHLPGGDVLAIRRPDSSEVLVPFLRAMVPVVDVPGRRVVVTPPEGLLELST